MQSFAMAIKQKRRIIWKSVGMVMIDESKATVFPTFSSFLMSKWLIMFKAPQAE